ncbi:MAG: SDR family oxidoreductase [Flavobacteriales bacterium]|nr:SDR family oxidoreductase [Flavobacteriales bacterium]
MDKQTFHEGDLSSHSFLVTGGGGFIGSHIVEYLLQHNAGLVRVLDNFSTGDALNLKGFKGNLEVVEGDICDVDTCRKACEGITYVLHQAALGSVPRSLKDPLHTHQVNVTGFVNMLVAAKDANVKRMVYASSSSVYGDSKELPKKEDRIGKPLSPYGASKLTDEVYAGVFHLNYGMNIIGLRYFNVFGPRQSPDGPYAAALPLFIRAISADTSAYIDGDGLQTRDFTYVENAVQANIKALFTKHPGALGQVFNVAYGQRTSILEMYTKINQILGKDIPAIHRESRAGDIRDSLASIEKAKEMLGYDPAVDLEEGLKRTLQKISVVGKV